MGLDGTNTLTVIGPPEVVRKFKESGLLFELDRNDGEYFELLQEHFFGHANVEILHFYENFLKVRYRFRNRVPTEYLERLLELHPKVWMKNEHYVDDDGACGVWVARFKNGSICVHEAEWSEPCMDEIYHVETDYSA